MNISTESMKKLKDLKNKLYKEIKEEIDGKIDQDGIILVFLDKIEKNYDYFFKTDDRILIEKSGDEITIRDNFDSKGEFIEADKLYNLIICKAKVKETIIDAITKYNKNNDKIKLLID